MKIPNPRKLSSGTYFIQLRLSGKSISVTAQTAKECRHKAQLIKAEHNAGKRLSAATPASLTLDQAMERYIDSRRDVLSPSTVRGYEAIRSNRFVSVSHRKLTTIDWQSVVNSESKLCSAKTLTNAWHFVASVLKSCGAEVPTVKLPQVVKPDKAWLEPEQIMPFVDAVRVESFAVPALLALHGLRRSEIYAVTWDSIDLTNRTITVRGAVVMGEDGFVRKSTNKNQTSHRTIPIMIPALLDLLTTAPRTTPPVTGSPVSLYKQVNRVCRQLGFPEVGVHGLRHSFASLGYHLGVPERQMMELGGWSDTATMHKIYTHIAQSDRAKTTNAITEFFAN